MWPIKMQWLMLKIGRKAGRLTGPKNTNGPADPIIVHPDVRRMLMETKAFNEGARALIYWSALMEDLETVHPDEKFREKADDYLRSSYSCD